MTEVYLGIDIGTSATKALAIDGTGKILAEATADYPVSMPRPGWSEQHPEDWWQATVKTIRDLVQKGGLHKDQVKGIGLSGQMHGSVFLDDQQQVIRPALLWNDQRTALECAEIESRAGGREALIGMVSNPALTGFTAPKILWLRNQEPAHFERLRQVLLPKDYVRFRLTGEFATEVSDASGTLLLDVKARDWSLPLLSKLELDRALLPRCYESQEITGQLTAAVAEQVGLAAGTPVVGGGGDQAAGAVGNGIVTGGIVSATLGTSGVVFAHSDEIATDPQGRLHTFCHAVKGKWHVMGVILAAGGSLQWFRSQLGQQEAETAKAQGEDSFDLLMALAAQAPIGSEGLYFLPYLTGERTPHADPYARGAWIGLTPRTTRAHLVRSLMEGVTYAMRDSLELIRGLNIPITQVRASGGGARSPFWRQMQADVYGETVVTINAQEGPAYGVALLAAVGTGAFPDVPTACHATIAVTHETEPDQASHEQYNRCYPIFGHLYQSLRGHFPAIAALSDS